MTVGAVDCDVESNRPLCSRYGVQGFPTIKIFGHQKQMNPYTKKAGKTPTDYTGARPPLTCSDRTCGCCNCTLGGQLLSLCDITILRAV